MKTKTFILLAVCYLIANTMVKAQAYIPFAKDGKMWTEKWEEINPNIHSIYIYTMNGDTLINGKIYKKVIGSNLYDNCFIYEDTLNRKVYCYNPSFSSSDFLLYDFNLQIGDTLEGSGCLVVTNKITEYFADKNRIKITFSGYGTVICYEGIGSLTRGVFLPKCIINEKTGSVLCYFENDTLLYHNSSASDSCFTLTHIKELSPEKLVNLYLYNHILYIKPTKPISYALSIYDIFGRKIKEINAKGDLEMDLSGLNNGLYIYRIESMDIHYSSKLILNQ